MMSQGIDRVKMYLSIIKGPHQKHGFLWLRLVKAHVLRYSPLVIDDIFLCSRGAG